MSTAAPSPSTDDVDPLWRLTVDQYHTMIDAGILTEEDPVELLEGLLVQKMPKYPKHSYAVRRACRFLTQVLPTGWFADRQEAITLSDSEPEPDGFVARGQEDDYIDHHPGPRDLALVVEISGSTLVRDQTRKKRIYARANIPVYWIVNLVDGRVEVYTDPTGPTEQPDYRQRQDFGPVDSVPVVVAGQQVGSIAVRDLLP